MNTEELITYVRHIERVLGPTQSYKLLEPFDWCSGDIKIAQAELVEAGRKVGNFLSLQQLTFLLLWADQEPGIAGHIHLSYGQQSVDVEVSTKLHPFPKCVLATVAHEYSHKVLHRNGLDHADREKNERLTDACGVYCGLGKLLLNGAYEEVTKVEYSGGQSRQVRHTQQVGYLSIDELAFVYVLVCTIRNIAPVAMYSGLDTEARTAVDRALSEFNSLGGQRFNESEHQSRLVSSAEAAIREEQQQLAIIERQIALIRDDVFANRQARLRASHRELLIRQKKIDEVRQVNANPHLQFLDSWLLASQLSAVTIYPNDDLTEISKILKLGSSSPSSAPVIIECPIDRTKLRVPSHKPRLLVSCPKCGYRFIVKTDNEFTAERPPQKAKSIKTFAATVFSKIPRSSK